MLFFYQATLILFLLLRCCVLWCTYRCKTSFRLIMGDCGNYCVWLRSSKSLLFKSQISVVDLGIFILFTDYSAQQAHLSGQATQPEHQILQHLALLIGCRAKNYIYVLTCFLPYTICSSVNFKKRHVITTSNIY